MRAMRFLYEKEFVAQKSGGSAAVAALYRERGLSTDTAVEAGYVVHLGLATLKALESTRRIRRVLIVGPGLDLAPRTGLLEAGPPETYQPYAVVDSLVSLGLSAVGELVVTGADVNPRVVSHIETAPARDVRLTLVSGLADSPTVTLQEDFRKYFTEFGRSIGAPLTAPDLPARYDGHLRKALRVHREVSSALTAVRVDVASETIDAESFDLIVATNILPYLDDTLLTIALANIARMLAPDGVLLHNEARALVGDVTPRLGLPLRHARTGVIATVRGAPPLADGVWIHVKAQAGAR
jgi:SAM-dependent methyltransferase